MRRQRKFKIQRKLNVLLPGFGDKNEKGPLAKRPFPPGFHGRVKNRRLSDFGIRLKEKQKVRFHYGLKEKQMRNLVKKSKKLESNWISAFVDKIERRLDNILFRSGFFPTIPAARQATVHGHILINGKPCDIPSITVNVGDEISLKKKTFDSILVQSTLKEPTLEIPHFLKLENKEGMKVGVVTGTPVLEDVPFQFDEQYFIEFYGKTK